MYAIYYTSGDRFRSPDGLDKFTAAEAAIYVADAEWAWDHGNGTIPIGPYRTRSGLDPARAITGRRLARTLTARAARHRA